MTTPVLATDCCICFEEIQTLNCAVTGCGHAFCFQCLGLAMAHKNACPCCRAKLIDVPGDDDEEEDAPAGDGAGAAEDDDDAHSVTEEGDVEDVVQRLQDEGFTMLDLTSMLLNRYSKRDAAYTNEHIGHINMRFDQLAAEVDMQHIEGQRLAREDTRSRLLLPPTDERS